MIEHAPDPQAHMQIFMHHQPGFQRNGEGFWQQPRQIKVAPGDADLADAHAIARALGGELRQIVVGAERERLPGQFDTLAVWSQNLHNPLSLG